MPPHFITNLKHAHPHNNPFEFREQPDLTESTEQTNTGYGISNFIHNLQLDLLAKNYNNKALLQALANPQNYEINDWFVKFTTTIPNIGALEITFDRNLTSIIVEKDGSIYFNAEVKIDANSSQLSGFGAKELCIRSSNQELKKIKLGHVSSRLLIEKCKLDKVKFTIPEECMNKFEIRLPSTAINLLIINDQTYLGQRPGFNDYAQILNIDIALQIPGSALWLIAEEQALTRAQIEDTDATIPLGDPYDTTIFDTTGNPANEEAATVLLGVPPDSTELLPETIKRLEKMPTIVLPIQYVEGQDLEQTNPKVSNLIQIFDRVAAAYQELAKMLPNLAPERVFLAALKSEVLKVDQLADQIHKINSATIAGEPGLSQMQNAPLELLYQTSIALGINDSTVQSVAIIELLNQIFTETKDQHLIPQINEIGTHEGLNLLKSLHKCLEELVKRENTKNTAKFLQSFVKSSTAELFAAILADLMGLPAKIVAYTMMAKRAFSELFRKKT